MFAEMKTFIAAFAVFGILLTVKAQPTNSFPLWRDGAPGALGKNDKDIPTLTPFFPRPGKATGAAFVVCPGGGYQHLAEHEGKGYALWLADHGIAAFVLKYRLGPEYHHPAMLEDAARAIRTVRANAAAWKIDPNRIGIIGSSAGGHLASTLLTHFDAGNTNAADVIERQSSRPDLGILCYAVITMGKFTHQGSKKNLLGANPPPELIHALSNELNVKKDTPPCFIWATDEDKTVPVENSMMFAESLRAKGIPFELHIYEKGPHGMGLGIRQYTPANLDKMLPWTRDCMLWLKERGYAN